MTARILPVLLKTWVTSEALEQAEHAHAGGRILHPTPYGEGCGAQGAGCRV